MAIYPREFEELLSVYLSDGIISDKERKVLLAKAEKLGLNRDEVDLYIDGREQEIRKQKETKKRVSLTKKCPFCGAPVPELVDKCAECGNFVSPEANEELKKIINELEEALVDLKAGKDLAESKAKVERYARQAKLYYGSNPKIKILLKELDKETIKAKREGFLNSIKNLIRNHPKAVCFGIILLIEVILLIIFNINQDIALNTYHNLSRYSNRSGAWDTYESFKDKTWFMIFVIIGTLIIAMCMRKKDE